MSNKPTQSIRYYIVMCDRRFLFIGNNSTRMGDSYDSPYELLQKHEACKVPLDQVSLTPPSQEFLTSMLKLYVTAKPLEPVEIDDDLREHIKSLKSS